MISIQVTVDAAKAREFIVRFTGRISNPTDLHAALAAALEQRLKDHFLSRNAEPNKLGGTKTNFWNNVADNTAVTEVRADGAVVSIGSESHFRIHLLGGVIKPTGGRKWLTIPIISQARGLRVSEYELQSGHKLFRLRGRNVLMERTGGIGSGGDRLLPRNSIGVIRGKSGFRKIGVGGGSLMRAVYALATEATIKKDPNALPPQSVLLTALQSAADSWAASIQN